MPQVRFLNLGLGVDVSSRGVGDASRTEALPRHGASAFLTFCCYRKLLLLEDDPPKRGRGEEVVWRRQRLRIADSRLSNDWAQRYGQAVDYRQLTFQNHETG